MVVVEGAIADDGVHDQIKEFLQLQNYIAMGHGARDRGTDRGQNKQTLYVNIRVHYFTTAWVWPTETCKRREDCGRVSGTVGFKRKYTIKHTGATKEFYFTVKGRKRAGE